MIVIWFEKKLESMNYQFLFHQKTLRNGWIPWKNWQRTGGYEGCYLRLWLPTYQNVIWRQTWWWCKRRSESNFADFAYLLIRLEMEPNVETRLGAKTGEDFPDKVFISKFWRWCVIVPHFNCGCRRSKRIHIMETQAPSWKGLCSEVAMTLSPMSTKSNLVHVQWSHT
jgi:hypothetical protein